MGQGRRPGPLALARRATLVACSLVAACGGSDPVAPDLSVEQPGDYAVGTTRFTATDSARARTLTMQAWYPTDAAPADVPFAMLEAEPDRTTYADLLAAAPAACPTRTTHVALDATPAAGSFPAVLFSHCHSCTRLSNATTAERLASHGFVVVSVDHEGDDLWNHLAGMDGDLDATTLQLRAGDLTFALDQLAAGSAPVTADLDHVGVFGHSFGAVTAGMVTESDARVSAGMALCAPMENPLTPGVTIANIDKPLGFVVAKEDNSITEFGNQLIRMNFTNALDSAWKIEIPDAGHWSVSDIDGLSDAFEPGCGEAMRQTDGTAFTYLDPATGRAIAAAYVTAFFEANLLGSAGARAYLSSAQLGVEADSH